MRNDEHIGARIATWRRIRGHTQRQLAEGTNTSLSLIQKIERGERAATGSVISAASRYLGIDRGTLTGQPYLTRDRGENNVHASVTAIRRELASYQMPPEDEVRTPDLATLGALTAKVSAMRHRADFDALGTALPLALQQLRHATHATSGTAREAVMAMLAEVYYAARQLTHKLGYFDLTSLLADRYGWAAGQAGNPHLQALADVLRAGDLDSVGDCRSARTVLRMTTSRFDLRARSSSDLSVWGWLHLMSAYTAAHARDSAATWAHYEEARAAAESLATDQDHYRLAFGPTNVAIWGTALGVELMDSAEALERAQHVHLTPSTPPERAGHHYIDLARAQLLHGRRDAALRSLLTARSITPQQVRHHPLARDTVITLAQTERRSTSTLRSVANWMGIED
ncbi:helix-turn-helix domain-containing protein [Asanoa siamensis]|uniref:Transcriptional regulator n=1 Tax=Asanoa siamensis TaxID=926357 RepID=A0ABQ4CWH0_9ACTN|nr:helix-turn-helix domain-containing protein [Asanoa siamensis]GIF75634.1 transcriptional regulator [Asanoa siamensis]